MSILTPRRLVGIAITDGLGNQLFMYAAGFALASRLNGDLRVDVRTYRSEGVRQFRLPAFGLDLKTWSPTWWKVERFIREKTKGRWRPGPERLVEASDLDPRLFTINAPCFLRGYFQSWRYFEGYEDDIRSLFDTVKLRTPRIAEIERRIVSTPTSVMVHVRRGDYGGDKFLELQRDYYDRARETILGRAPEPTFFLFSDDLPQAVALLEGWPNVVPVEGFSDLEDFRLMSLCRHFVIANSTFSWWGAWLGSAPDKIVIGPKTWLGPGYERVVDMEARLPPEWIRV